MTRVLAIPICFLLAGACGQLPRPFQSEPGSRNDLLVLEDRAGILVAAPAGDLPADPDRLAQAMAARLRKLNVPATTDAVNGESRYLHGWAAGAPGELVVEWELWELDGRLIGAYTQRRRLAAAPPKDGIALIEALAADAAPRIAALVQAPPVAEARIPGFPGARLVVPPLGAGPGDSVRSLAPALRAELAAAGLPVSARQSPSDILVLGEIVLEPAREGGQEVAIAWSVVRAGSREELGRVEQRNRVPAGSLDGPWGHVARDIARAAAQGVIDLLERRAEPRRTGSQALFTHW